MLVRVTDFSLNINELAFCCQFMGFCELNEKLTIRITNNISRLIIRTNSGSGCGSADRAVASNSRGPRFEFILNVYYQLY